MTSSDYYAIQFIQSRYLLLWEAGQQAMIADALFSRDEDISVSYVGFACEARGQIALRDFFSSMAEKATRNGSILRCDLPTSQHIQISPDGKTALGKWITMSAQIEGPVFGNETPPYPLPYYLGIYKNKFLRQDGEWRLKALSWEPVLQMGDWKMDPNTCGGLYYKQPEKWPEPFVPASRLEGGSPQTEENIAVRTLAFDFAHRHLQQGISAIDDKSFSPTSAKSARNMLNCEPHQGFHGALLFTSPIASVSESLDSAKLFLNTLWLRPESGAMVSSNKGRICAELSKNGNMWRFETFDWYRYATLEPWPITVVGSASVVSLT